MKEHDENCKRFFKVIGCTCDGRLTEVEHLKNEIAKLRAALEQIRDQDYRGNRCSCSQLAFRVLK